MFFITHICSLTQLAWSLGLGCHQYVSDTQLFLLRDGQPETVPGNTAKGLRSVMVKVELATGQPVWCSG